MSGRTTVRSLAAELAILDLLNGGPLTSREISQGLFRQNREAWAERHEVEADWGDDPPPEVRLLSSVEAEENGYVLLHPWEVYSVLRRLERKGRVDRLQVEGRRQILWLSMNPRKS